MQNIHSTIELKEAIRLLAIEQARNNLLLREQFHLTYESLKPVSLLKSTLEDISSSPFLLTNIVGTITSLISGYLSKKMVVGSSTNIFRKFLGVIMQIGVANTIRQHPNAIKSIGKYFLKHIFVKKEQI